ncbi:uncharacterized protein N7529_000319 [Penicillium soppii]|uniref:uncharacterized protein n=1 Tax=Penicillium soppii TaxID=69789 RepID=UPI002547AAD5|nr:uncharacterized protein N7529_000319 [Penicillium soppii]KAJ5881647.1 hypothetical protein N7529_000319 [Penicillium soppii]
MTDTSSLAITHATTDYPPVRATRASPEVTDGASDSAAAEEDYTIKCVCRFEDDDGHTVFCERCDTWQHIICYYESKEDVPDVHNCVDCEPRYVDRRRAVHKQSEKRLEEKRRSVDPERKPRRPGNKANKRKSKDTDAHEPNLKRHDSTARDQPPAKKPKASHRSSTSTSGLASAPAQSRNRRPSTAVPVSPTTSDSRVPLYSNEFLHLYDRDHTFVEKDSNLLPGVSFVDEIISWLRDPEILARVTEGLSSEDFAQHCEAAFDSPWPTLRTHTYTDSSVDIDGKHPTFKILKTDDPIREGQIVGEIFGEVGHIDHYKANPSNRWKTLQHPEPFVYFSSQLPLYIDSRQEGNQLRYIRRSCNSNVSLKIYITNSREYHFCFVARRDIPANSEITVMWYLDPALIKDKKASKPKYKPGLEDNTVEEDLPALCFSNILADFGGCPCGRNQNCSLANLDRRSDAASNKATKTKGKAKAKSKSVASPMDPGRASTSRAGSESTKHVEDDDAMTDVRSTSGSVRDRVTHSRDVSPTDKQTLPGLSSRERRKIADAEMQFRRLEKGAPTTKGAVGTKRKKRVSGPSAQPTATSRSTQTGEPGAKQKPQPHSPTANSPRSVATDQHAPSRKSAARTVLPTSETIDRYKPSPYRRVGPYVDASTQLYENDVETEFWHLEHLRRGYRVGILPDSKMYLARFVAGSKMQGDREQQEKYTGDSSLIPSGVIPWWCNYFPFPLDDRTEYDLLPEDARLMGIPLDHGPLKLPLRWSFWQRKEPRRPTKFAGSSAQGDITMQEASLHNELSNPLVPPPWPSAAAHTIKVLGADNHGSPRLSMPPPSASNIQSPSSPRPISAGSYTTTANRDTASSHPPVPTPVSAPIATPAKKKLSLGDYLMRRETMANTPASDSPQAPERAPNSTPVWVTTTEHYLAITKLPDDWSEPRPRPLTPDARGDKNEPSDSQEVIMEDAPESAPTSTEPAPTNPPSISS